MGTSSLFISFYRQAYAGISDMFDQLSKQLDNDTGNENNSFQVLF